MATIKDILLEVIFSEAGADRYQEGYRAGLADGYAKAVAELRNTIAALRIPLSSELLIISPRDESRLKEVAVAPAEKPSANRIPTKEKDRRLREYLAEHPPSRYGDLKEQLGPQIAKRAYPLRDRGDIEQTADGRFQLTTTPSWKLEALSTKAMLKPSSS
jgi:hypothetical protein